MGKFQIADAHGRGTQNASTYLDQRWSRCNREYRKKNKELPTCVLSKDTVTKTKRNRASYKFSFQGDRHQNQKQREIELVE